MSKHKEHPKYNIISMRISDKEMPVLAQMKQKTCKSTTMLLREAMQLYANSREFAAKQGITA
jgi:hypothetical protein